MVESPDVIYTDNEIVSKYTYQVRAGVIGTRTRGRWGLCYCAWRTSRLMFATKIVWRTCATCKCRLDAVRWRAVTLDLGVRDAF